MYIVYVRGCVCYQNHITKCCYTIIIIVAFHTKMYQLYGVALMKHMVLLVTRTNNYKIMVVYYQLNYYISEHIE